MSAQGRKLRVKKAANTSTVLDDQRAINRRQKMVGGRKNGSNNYLRYRLAPTAGHGY